MASGFLRVRRKQYWRSSSVQTGDWHWHVAIKQCWELQGQKMFTISIANPLGRPEFLTFLDRPQWTSSLITSVIDRGQLPVFLNNFIYLFLAALALRCSMGASHCSGFSWCGAQALSVQVSVVLAHELICPKACGTFPDQELNPCSPHWQAYS